MMKIKNNLLSVSMICCFCVIIFAFVTILMRLFTRQVLIKKWGWDNQFTQIVFWDNKDMRKLPGLPDDNGGQGSVSINWAERYPFPIVEGVKDERIHVNLYNAENFSSAGLEWRSKIKQYTTEKLFGYVYIVQLEKMCNKMIDARTEILDEVFCLENGYLAYTEPKVSHKDLQRLADYVADFAEYLRENNIGFLYVNAGSKVCKHDKKVPKGEVENTNENADVLITLLTERNVEVLDYRPKQEEKYPDWYSSYYITDHHWKNTTGLWAAGELACFLNDKYGFDFDLSLFDESSYIIETKENYFFGPQGKKFTTALVGLEPFSKIIPRFDTDLSIQIPTRSIDIRGNYSKTLFRENFYDSIAEYSLEDFNVKADAYHSVMWLNDSLGTITNHLSVNNKGKRILMLQDSFGYWLSTYLALDIQNIDLINRRKFNGSLKSYIEQSHPDVVVLLLCEKNIKPIDEGWYSNHVDYFDFR